MEGKCGMQIRVLLVTRSYADAIYMKNLLPWEQLGFQLLIELNSISGLQKVTDLHPQVLMLFGSLGAADLDLFLEYSQKENLRLYIIILPNKQHQVDEPVTETANSGTAHLYFVPKLTDGTLLKVLEDIRDEEKAHMGELITLMRYLDPSETDHFLAGESEVREMLEDLGIVKNTEVKTGMTVGSLKE